MNSPIKSYRIWHANRSGSTLLCQLLEDTGIAGKPGEHFTLHGESSLAEKFNAQTYTELVNKVWSVGTTPNGVFADKATAHYQGHHDIITEICQLGGVEMTENYEEIWKDIFPNCKHILIIRTNKVRQAVSWWKAIQDDQWHIIGDQKRTKQAAFYEDKYNPDALRHLFKEAVIRDIANQEYLTNNDLNFITITYEDLVNDPNRIINTVMSYLEIEPPIDLPKFRYQKTANEVNEEWVERFKVQIQKEWEAKVWV